eukprot:1584806-Rhodomonas_salina.1
MFVTCAEPFCGWSLPGCQWFHLPASAPTDSSQLPTLPAVSQEKNPPVTTAADILGEHDDYFPRYPCHS